MKNTLLSCDHGTRSCGQTMVPDHGVGTRPSDHWPDQDQYQSDDQWADFRLATPSLEADQSSVIITQNPMITMGWPRKYQTAQCVSKCFKKWLSVPRSRNVSLARKPLSSPTDFISRPLCFPFERLAHLFELQISTNVTLIYLPYLSFQYFFVLISTVRWE